MTALDLLAELRSAAMAVRQPHLDRLRGIGVPIGYFAEWAMAYGVHPFGVANVEPIGSGHYQPGEGRLHIILPVIEDGVLVDLVAFRPDTAADWLLRTGNSTALGLEEGTERWTWYQPAYDRRHREKRHQVGQPAHLFSDPLDWMRGGGEGLCVVDWESPEIYRLDVLPELVCSTPTVAALLTRALSRPARLPKLSLMETRNVA
jgi:hypothetical protein